MSDEQLPFRKILVANRGEIACRVFRTCRQAGIATVAVYSDADANSVHVREADEAVHVGPTPSAQSYLKTDAILDAALRTKADAIHPGYGFLSERADFARACEEAGVTFIGPPGTAMHVMGDKVRSRKAMIEAGVPVVPGHEELASADDAAAAAAEVGYPVMLKATAGGGGKGMRIVTDEASLRRGFEAASREALAAFGDGRMFLERAVMKARHVEIQVMADAHGNVVSLGERDCSVQRRNQKVIEESPSPSPQMNPEVRARMGDVACQVARAVGYRSAGTVEFLFEETERGPQFYFLEMNTRLQVEHPVTEEVVGRDLVLDQIRVAAGLDLGYTSAEVSARGHAIECRIYAEDPVRFLPSPGVIRRLLWPTGSGIRIDSAVVEGSEVSSHYDPMIAKLTVWGPTRAEAIARMRGALEGTIIVGISTNIPFHLRVLAEPDFNAGTFTTRYIQEHEGLLSPADYDPELSREVAAAAAVLAGTAARQTDGPERGDSQEISAWQQAVWWRG